MDRLAGTKEIGHCREVPLVEVRVSFTRIVILSCCLKKILDIPVSLLPPLILSPCLPNHHQEGSSVNQKIITEAEQQLNTKLVAKVQQQKNKMN